MPEHVHEWVAEYDVVVYGESFQCECGELMATDEIARRLNAVEMLNPHLVGSLAYDSVFELHWRAAFADYAKALYGDAYQVPNDILERAAALEGTDLDKLPTQQKLTAEDMNDEPS